MDDDDVWRAIDAQRTALADILEDLSEQEWHHPSLCEGWTVRDVAAHLTMQQTGLGDVLRQTPLVIRSRGNLNRVIHDAACRRAEQPTGTLVAQIRGTVGSRRHNIGVTCRETLIDILVHSQDIVIPLGRRLDLSPDAAAEAATRIWSRGWPFYPRRRLHGYRLSATDVPWTVGEGDDVRGPIGSMLLLITGRLTGVDQVVSP